MCLLDIQEKVRIDGQDFQREETLSRVPELINGMLSPKRCMPEAPAVTQWDWQYLGTQVWSPAWPSGLGTQCCHSCSSGGDCGSDLTPGPGVPRATGRPKEMHDNNTHMLWGSEGNEWLQGWERRRSCTVIVELYPEMYEFEFTSSQIKEDLNITTGKMENNASLCLNALQIYFPTTMHLSDISNVRNMFLNFQVMYGQKLAH